MKMLCMKTIRARHHGRHTHDKNGIHLSPAFLFDLPGSVHRIRGSRTHIVKQVVGVELSQHAHTSWDDLAWEDRDDFFRCEEDDRAYDMMLRDEDEEFNAMFGDDHHGFDIPDDLGDEWPGVERSTLWLIDEFREDEYEPIFSSQEKGECWVCGKVVFVLCGVVEVHDVQDTHVRCDGSNLAP